MERSGVVAPRLPLFAEDVDASVQRALTLALSVCAALELHHTTRYGALALLADCALPALQAAAARTDAAAAPPLYPLSLACVLVAAKLHERHAPRISALLGAASRCAPGFQDRCSAAGVGAAELWLLTCVATAPLRPCSDYVTEQLDALRERAPQQGVYFDLALTLSLFELLYERPYCRGLLTSGAKGLAAALITAAAALTVPRQHRAAHAPALTWLAGMAGERVEDVHDMAAEILRLCLRSPAEDAAEEEDEAARTPR